MERKIILFIIILTAGFCFGQSKSTAQYIRWNVNTPEGKANLDAMNIAFKKMRDLGCENGLSWYYQGAIHSVPKEINGKNRLCSVYQTRKDKLWAWVDCTHDNTGNASLNFLLWHRMYIWYLEKIVRELSGKADFALPYWNYGSVQTVENVLEPQLRDKSGALYTAARYSVLNNGKPIPSDKVKQIQLQIGELENNPSFTGSAGFSESLESAPHGFMHNLIGGGYAIPSESFYNEIFQTADSSGLMADVESAGFDPVFWLHHSMIDRIWESWDVSAYGQRPTLQELKDKPWPYEFITPDGGHVTYTMEEVYKIVFNLDYKYDNLLYGSKTPVLAENETKETKETKLVSFQDSKEKIIWEKKVGKVLGATAFSHKVTGTSAKNTLKIFKSTNSKIVLNLDVVVYKEPKDYYTVYLRYKGKPDQYVGTMTFFGVAHEHGKGAKHEIGEEGVKLSFSYYISDDLANKAGDFDIIIKKTGIGDAKVTLEKISTTEVN